MELWHRLKECRTNMGFQQNEIADRINVKNNTLSSYESGTRKPDYQTLVKLADIYEVTTDYLLRGENKGSDNLFFFDKEGLTNEEIDDIKRHIDYVKWKAKQEKENNYDKKR